MQFEQKENRPPTKEDFFVHATLRLNTYEITGIPCKIYLPENPLSKPRLEFKPNYEQWQQASVLWQTTFESRVLDRFGRLTTHISAPDVYLENMQETQWGPDLYDCAFNGKPENLCVIQHLDNSGNITHSKTTRFSLWMSPNSMLQPTIIMKSSYTGNVEIERLKQIRFPLTRDIQLNFDTEYKHKKLLNAERVQWSILVAYLDCSLPASNVDAFNSSIIPIVDDFLWVAGFGSRIRTACVGWAASDGRTYTRYYRGNLVFPTGDQEPSFVDGLVSRADYEEFLSNSWTVFNDHPGRNAIKGSIQSLLPNRHQTLEDSFLSLFAGLEELLLDYRIRNGLEFIISDEAAWKRIRTSIRKVIKNFSDPGIEKHQRALFYSKLQELNRVPLRNAFEQFCSHLGIDLSDLWPVFPNADGVGLVNVRNKLIHGDRFPAAMINPLSIARENLKWALERAVIRVLGWPVEQTDVAPHLLSAGATSLTEMPAARKQLSEYLSEKT